MYTTTHWNRMDESPAPISGCLSPFPTERKIVTLSINQDAVSASRIFPEFMIFHQTLFLCSVIFRHPSLTPSSHS
jgi:hypothetical protein